MERYALFFTVRPGTEEQAAEILRNYGRPSVQAGVNTQMFSTSVFMKGNMIVRIVDIDGDLKDLIGHLPTQNAIRKAEEALEPLLEQPRNLNDPADAQRFFQNSLMQRITHREAGKPAR
jgi:hypothetical protein